MALKDSNAACSWDMGAKLAVLSIGSWELDGRGWLACSPAVMVKSRREGG